MIEAFAHDFAIFLVSCERLAQRLEKARHRRAWSASVVPLPESFRILGQTNLVLLLQISDFPVADRRGESCGCVDTDVLEKQFVLVQQILYFLVCHVIALRGCPRLMLYLRARRRRCTRLTGYCSRMHGVVTDLDAAACIGTSIHWGA